MLTDEYEAAIYERDNKALSIYHEQGEEAYWQFMNENKITAPPIFFEEKKVKEEKKEWLPRLHKDEMQLLREAYYYDQHKEINLSNF